MSVNVSDVKRLNERIEAIQRKADRAKSQSEVFLDKLNKEIADYEKKYGVKLSGKSIDETMQLIEAESQKVSSAIEEEYSLKKKVVDAIDRGDITEANRLLGVNTEENGDTKEPESTDEIIDESMKSNITLTDRLNGRRESYSVVSSGKKSISVDEVKDAVSVSRISEDTKVIPERGKVTTERDTVSVTAKKGIILDEPEENVKPANLTFDAGDMSFDDFDEGSNDSADSNEDSDFDFGVSNGEDNSMDDNDDDFDFGFGALLKGTKFGN